MKKTLDFICKTSSGMASGLFATLIVGTIIKQICQLIGFEYGVTVANVLSSLMGVGIAIGVALAMDSKLSLLETVCVSAVGGVASATNLESFSRPIPTITVGGGSKNPLLIYLVVIFTVIVAKKVLTKKTPVDILIVPLVYVTVGAVLSVGFIYPCYYVIYGIQKIIEVSMPLMPIVMSAIISVVMGAVLTMPISSVAVCVAINIGNTPLAAGAAVIGCTVQMIGFAVQSMRAGNGFGKTVGVGIGTSMLYWPNILKKPAIWLPTLIASLILGPIGVCLVGTCSTSAGAGMGSCGLVGQLSTLEAMGYANAMSYVSIFVVQILGSIALVFLLDYLFRDVFKLYKKQDLLLA